MTYVMSDIHGNYQRFEQMLKKINLQSSDTLYILGDVVDRHPFGIKILKKIMKAENINMLLGNHEYMMMRALGFPYDSNDCSGEAKYELYRIWYRNGGAITNMDWNITPDNIKSEIKEYLLSLPLSYDIEVAGKKYKLVHAAPPEWFDIFGNELTETRTFFSVWDRNAVHEMDNILDIDFTLIFGHTPTVYFQKRRPPEIYFSDNKIGIDCACGHIDPPDRPDELKINGRLACLRLDDLKEFYCE